jgi:hypothetical protein
MSFVINEVSLQKLDDKMLQELFLKIRSKLNYASSNKGESKSVLKGLQIEMCYLQREIEMRSKYKKVTKEKK